VNRMGNGERSAREVAGDMPRETFEKAVEAAAKAVCAHRSYRMIAAEVLASVNHAGAVEALEFYADPKSWDYIHPERGTVTTDYPANRDRGQRARAALGEQS
jgi:hypothetical protein